ncbi:hypothetical protein SAY87_015459 [Trapa incisa]|uniref:Auxin-responsive protein n=1 Tax=Trapa incisa TaxID=236973 RepID=A0AAN7GR23_9MYRT|nr:hypothetical protein SAY87_015459 [Trapa incisa]
MEDEGQNDVSVASSSTVDCDLEEHRELNYLGLSDCSSAESYRLTGLSGDRKNDLNLKATELRLGLPGFQSPKREPNLHFVSSGKPDEKLLFPLLPLSQKSVVTGNKRGFSEVNDPIPKEGNWMFRASENEGPDSSNPGIKIKQSVGTAGAQSNLGNGIPSKQSKEHSLATSQNNASNNAPAAKAQVVGWPPVRSFRKNSLVSTSRNNEEVDGKLGAGALFIKVSMDGAPYLRKVDLHNYSTYQELSSALGKMFSCFIVGQCGSSGNLFKEMQTADSSKDLLHGSEYVLTYEDKDGDWMLVGDVPWNMFMNTCKKLKIMKGSDAIGLAPTAAEKSTRGY